MSGVIDKNVVQMVFDNVLFQKNAADTLSTLDKLKEALNFEGAVKGLENLSNQVKGTSMDALYNGVGKVQEGFSALDVVATRVLQNITDKVQNVAMDLAQKLTIEPIKAGLEEYETQINSVQTILANTNDALIEKGLTTEHDRIEKINGVLDDLNKYADMTIYNFTEMTRNIGTFTAAGVELDTAATSIKGIANLAAMSGSNSQQASTAMYQLSQAIAAGSVKLQDWNSVVNAGMGGKLFQNELIDTAKAMGVADEQFIALTQGATTFRESLSSGWISAEVLTNTLEKFTAGSEGYTKSQVEQMQQLWRARGYSEQQIKELTGSINVLTDEQEKNLRTKWAEKGFSDEQIDHILSMGTAATEAATKVKTFSQLLETVGEALQSGWTQSWEYIIGDFEQAKMLWTEISDIMNLYIGKSADARNNVLKEWSRAAYSYNENGELIKLTYDEAGNLIENADNQVVKGGKMIREEMGGRELVIQSLRNAFQGTFEVAMEFGKAWEKGFIKKGTADDISITAKTLKDLSLALYDNTTAFKNALSQRDAAGNAIGLLGQLRDSFDFFANSVRKGYDGIKDVFSGLGNIFSAFGKSSFFSIDTLNAAIGAFSAITGRIRDFGEAFQKHFGNDKNGLNKNGLINFFNGLESILESNMFVKLEFFLNLFDGIGKVVEHLIEPFGTFSQLLGKIGSKLSIFSDAFESIFYNEDVSKFDTFFDGLANGFNSFIDSLKSSVDFSGFSNFFNNLVEAMSSDKIDLFKIFENVFGGLVDILKAFLAIATPVAAAFANIFGGAIGEALQFVRDLSDRFKQFTESLIANQEVISSVQHLFEGIFSVIKAVGEVVGNVLLAAWDSLTKIFANFLPDGKSLSETFNNIGTKLTEVSKGISSLVSGDNGVPKLSELIGRITDKFIGFFGSLKDVHLLEKLADLLKKVGDGIKHALGGSEDMSLFDTIIEKIKNFLQRIKEVLSDEHGELDFVKVVEAGGIGVIIKKIIDMLKDLKDGGKNLTGVMKFINDLKEAFVGLAESLKEKFKAESIKAIATSILEIAGALFIIAMIDPVALAAAIAAIKGMFVMIEQLLQSTKGFNKTDIAALTACAAVLQTLGNAILMMAGAVYILGSMPLENVIQGLVALGIMLEGMVTVIKKLSKIEKDLPKISAGLMGLAVSLNLLVIPVVVLGNMDLINLAKGLLAVAAMMAGLVGSAILLSRYGNKFGASEGLGLMLMAEAINILGSAINKVADLSWEQVAKGLVVMAAGLAAMVGAAAIVDQASLSDELIAVGGTLMMLGISMMMLTEAAQGIADVSWEDLGKLAAVLAGALIALGIASYAINGKNLLMIGGAIALVATAFLELNAALGIAQLVGPLCTSISMAIEGMSNSLASFANHAAAEAFLKFLQDAILFLPKLAVGLAQAIIEFVAALGNGAGQIVGALVNLGKAVIGGIRELLPEFFALVQEFIEGALNLFITEAPKVFEALKVLFDQIWGFLTEQTPNFFGWLTQVFTELFTFLQTEGPMLVETIALLIDTVLQAIITEAPRVGETILAILNTALTVIQEAVPNIIQTLLSLLTNLLQQLAEYVPQMAQAALEIIGGFLQAIANNIQQITESAITIAIEFIKGVTSKLPEIVDAAFKFIIGFIDGLATAIENNHQALFDAIGHLIRAIIEAIVDGIKGVVEAGSQMLDEFIKNFNAGEFLKNIFDAGVNLVKNLLEGLGSLAKDIFDAGANLVQGFIDGILSMPGTLWDSACSIANDAWNAITQTLDEHSPSRLTYEGGKNFTIGFVNGISDYATEAEAASSDMAYGVLGAFASAMGSDSSEYAMTLVPVLDITDILEGKKNISTVLSGMSEDLITKLNIEFTERIEHNMTLMHSSVDRIDHKMQSMIYKIDSFYERMDYWLESIEGDTIEIAGVALNFQDKGTDIYMDTGALVGAIAPEMDNALGLTSIMSERGSF